MISGFRLSKRSPIDWNHRLLVLYDNCFSISGVDGLYRYLIGFLNITSYHLTVIHSIFHVGPLFRFGSIDRVSLCVCELGESRICAAVSRTIIITIDCFLLSLTFQLGSFVHMTFISRCSETFVNVCYRIITWKLRRAVGLIPLMICDFVSYIHNTVIYTLEMKCIVLMYVFDIQVNDICILLKSMYVVTFQLKAWVSFFLAFMSLNSVSSVVLGCVLSILWKSNVISNCISEVLWILIDICALIFSCCPFVL